MTKRSSPKAARETWRTILVGYPKMVDGVETPRNAGRIRRAYAKYRAENALPKRCDATDCIFHLQPLTWKGKPLPLILDHKDGNRWNNRPSNLQYLCPNCDAQGEFRGGKNIGRVIDNTVDGYELKATKAEGGTKIIGATGRASGTSTAIAIARGVTKTP
jgi:hypothetical protein